MPGRQGSVGGPGVKVTEGMMAPPALRETLVLEVMMADLEVLVHPELLETQELWDLVVTREMEVTMESLVLVVTREAGEPLV